MGILNNSNAISISGDYTLENSLRFRASADAYLSRANGSTATLATSGTISMWVKKPRNGSREYLMQTGSGAGNSNHFSLFFTNSTADTIKVGQYSVNAYINSTNLYRDSSAWYHIVMAFDSTESTGTDRVKIYVNGELKTNTSSAGASSNFAITNNGQTIYIGRESGYPSDTYMSEVQVIDGQTLAATDFGETDNNGTWIPKKYTGSYGNNGFYLKFDDTSSVAALGTDSSGNGNDFTPTNISLTAGVTYDSMPDVPTLTDEDTANFATRNPLAYSPSMTFSNGNLTTNGTLAGWYGSASTIFVNSGKWYWETTITVKGSYIHIGAAEENWAPNVSTGMNNNTYGYYSYNGTKIRNSTFTAYGTTYTTGDVIGVALDYDSGAIWFSKNGTWQNSATISEVQAGTTTNAAFTGVTERLTPASAQYGTATQNHNFGQRAFAYTQPTGFLKLNTFNLPDSTIEDGSTNFNTVLYTGDGAVDNAITGVGFQPDWTWIKERNGAANHGLYDAVRGVQKDLVSNTTGAETTQSTGLTAFDSDGFTTGVLAKLNTNNDTYVAWNWKAGGTGASNTNGTITSTVSANTIAGFSVVTYTGNGTSGATIGHGLGAVPQFVVTKARTSSTYAWNSWHTSLGTNYHINLNTTGGQDNSVNIFPTAGMTSTTFQTATSAIKYNNLSGVNYVAYVFTGIEGYSKFGSYTGNGNANGTFVYTGFKPAYVMIKRTNTTGSWYTFDNKREGYNVDNDTLLANTTAAETTTDYIDILSNGFKPRTTAAAVNTSGSTYVYMAFAKNPFKNSTAR